MNAPIDITSVVLKTDRLTLRPWQESDLQDFYEENVEGWNEGCMLWRRGVCLSIATHRENR